MIDFQLYDEFRDKLPAITFHKDLTRPLHEKRPAVWNARPVSDGEILISSLALDLNFPDTEGLLATSFEDFCAFMECVGIIRGKDGYYLRLEQLDLGCFEAYRIKITENGITVFSGDTEGVRRALIYIEDEMKRRAGNFLPIGEIFRKPFIKDRISRCYFTPASHAAIEEKENELCDENDYYPNEYLNRLMHDGINALWLGASLRYLVKSPLIPEYGQDAEKRMRKLNSVIEKCRKYGIRVFLFAVDPASSYNNPHLLKYPEIMDDVENSTWRLLCPSQPKALEYLRGAVKKLFTEAPNLAGYINLTLGESLSTCASNGPILRCKRCREKFGTIGKTLAFVEKTIADAMHEVSPDAKYISWTYEQRNWKFEDIVDSCANRDENVIHLQNFEDFGRPEQLGKKRIAYDYWLSYTGPGELFKKTLELNKKAERKTYAKIQVCSSHEISTVPYVISPGILYDKYKYFLDNGIEGVMQCWFFGNYPCLMNKAAGELAFLPFAKTKKEFLKHLAGVYWGEDAECASDAWLQFEEGYSNFPVSVSFEWLGPMQDSPVAPLHLKPIDRSMPSTWLATDAVGGDRLGEAMCNGHTHEEILELVGRMVSHWSAGMDILDKIDGMGDTDREEQKNVARATSYIFKSGYNVIKFYFLRRLLAIGAADPEKLLADMKDIVKEEISVSESLIPICERDNRIGYHSEAHGHKIFPEKLKWRINKLKELLATEFPETEVRIGNSMPPLAFYTGEESDVVYRIGRDGMLPLVTKDGAKGSTEVSIEETDREYKLSIYANNFGNDYILIRPEFRLFHPSINLLISKEKPPLSSAKLGFLSLSRSSTVFSIHPDDACAELEKYEMEVQKASDGDCIFTMTFNKKRFGMERGEPFRLDIQRFDGDKVWGYGCLEAKEALNFSDKTVIRLVHGYFSPECYAFIIPKT